MHLHVFWSIHYRFQSIIVPTLIGTKKYYPCKYVSSSFQSIIVPTLIGT